MNKIIIRKAYLELLTAEDKQVVKVAGIVNKLKSYLKKLVDSEYANAVDKLEVDSKGVQIASKALSKSIEDLLEAISDGEIEKYDLILEEVRGLTGELNKQLSQLNKDSDKAVQENTTENSATSSYSSSGPKSYSKYKPEEWKDKKQRNAIFAAVSKKIKEWYPDHDVPISTEIRRPISSFEWFKNKKIHIKQGSERTARDNIIDKIVKKLAGAETILTEKEIRDVFNDQENFAQLSERLGNAIWGGNLISYTPSEAVKQERKLGEMKLIVRTSDFVLPVLGVVLNLAITLADLSTTNQSDNKLIVRFVNDVHVSSIPPVLTKGGKKITKEKVAEPPPKQDPVKIETEEANLGESFFEPGETFEQFKNKLEDQYTSFHGKNWDRDEELVEQFVQSLKRKKQQLKEEEETKIPSALKVAPQEEEPKPKEPQKKKIVMKKSSLKNRLFKLAGIDFSASQKLSDNFWKQFVDMSKRLGAKPEDLAKVINSESRFDAHATNVQKGKVVAKGLNQLIKPTALKLGMTENEWNNYENESPEEQLKYVEKFFKLVGPNKKAWNSATELYVANFAPSFISKSSDPNVKLYSKEQGQNYLQNKGLDKEGKGFITISDMTKAISKLPEHIIQAINKAKGLSETNINPTTPVENDNSSELLNVLFAGDNGPLEKIVKNAIEKQILPTSKTLISISSLSTPKDIRYKFANSLYNLLNNVIDSEISIHENNNKIELSCTTSGSQYNVNCAIDKLCNCASQFIKTKYGFDIKYVLISNSISKFAEINI